MGSLAALRKLPLSSSFQFNCEAHRRRSRRAIHVQELAELGGGALPPRGGLRFEQAAQGGRVLLEQLVGGHADRRRRTGLLGVGDGALGNGGELVGGEPFEGQPSRDLVGDPGQEAETEQPLDVSGLLHIRPVLLWRSKWRIRARSGGFLPSPPHPPYLSTIRRVLVVVTSGRREVEVFYVFYYY